MSKWYEPKIDDMSINKEDGEIDILIDQDEFGAVYVAVKIEDIEKLLAERKKIPETELTPERLDNFVKQVMK